MRTRTAIALLAALAAAPAFAADYVPDPAHTNISFTWNHFGFSNQAGIATDIKGAIQFDGNPLKAKVDITIPVASLNTHVGKLDQELQTADWLDAAKYPDIHFVSTAIRKGDGTDNFKVDGQLTIHGVTKPVTLDAHLNKFGLQPLEKVQDIGFDANATINRADFGVGKYVPMVSNALAIHISVEAKVPRG